jgi:hypothetical protein
VGIKKSITDMIGAAGGWEDAAYKLGMSISVLQNRVYGKKGSVLSIDHALSLQTISNTTLFAEAIALASGGTFVALPQITDEDVTNEELLLKFQQLCEEFGRLGHRHREATEDGHVDAQERADLQAIADSMHRRIQELLAITFRIYCVSETDGAAAMHRVADLATSSRARG